MFVLNIFYSEIVRHVKSMDLSRPVTIAISQHYAADRAVRQKYFLLQANKTDFM